MAAEILCLPKKVLFLHRTVDLDLVSGLTSSSSSCFAESFLPPPGSGGDGEDGGCDWWCSSAIVASYR